MFTCKPFVKECWFYFYLCFLKVEYINHTTIIGVLFYKGRPPVTEKGLWTFLRDNLSTRCSRPMRVEYRVEATNGKAGFWRFDSDRLPECCDTVVDIRNHVSFEEYCCQLTPLHSLRSNNLSIVIIYLNFTTSIKLYWWNNFDFIKLTC